MMHMGRFLYVGYFWKLFAMNLPETNSYDDHIIHRENISKNILLLRRKTAYMEFQNIDFNKEEKYILFLIIWSYLWGVFRYTQVRFTSVQFDSDAIGVWHPFAKAVLNGAIPYTHSVWDNKPPFFQVLNIISEATGRYFLFMIIFVATANAVIAYILFKIWEHQEGPQVALLIGALYLSALSYTGTNINPRTFAILFTILAIFSKSIQSIGRGVLMATGALFSQQVIFAAPVVLLRAIQTSKNNIRSTVLKFTFGGLGTVAIAYGSLGIIYGTNTVIRAIYYTNGITTGYFTKGEGKHILANTGHWVIDFLSAFDDLALIIVSATYSAYLILFSNQTLFINGISKNMQDVGVVQLLLLISLVPALLLRPSAEYWIFFFPSLAGLAGYGIKSFVTSKESANQ